MNTMIISAFAGCGKTYLYNEQHRAKFYYNGEVKYYSFLDSDSSKFEKEPDWVDTYMEHIKSKIGTVDFIFVANHDCVLQALKESGLPFIVVTPDNSPWLDNKERWLIKQQWFGRFVLRDNSHIADFPAWLNHLKERYDTKTSPEHIAKYNPVAHFTLKENQYLSDIIQDLYWKKETYTERYCCKEIFRPVKVRTDPTCRTLLEILRDFRIEQRIKKLNSLDISPELVKYPAEYNQDLDTSDFYNLRYVLGDIVKMLCGTYNKENAIRVAKNIGISGEAMMTLLESGRISKNDFEKICEYLSPDDNLKARWYESYVIQSKN